jgi:predicted aspartyl protease
MMMTVTVADNGVSVIMLQVAGQIYPGIIDTGFNGDLELPNNVCASVNTRFIGTARQHYGTSEVLDENPQFSSAVHC